MNPASLTSESSENLQPTNLNGGTGQGLEINRVFTREGINPLDEVEYEFRDSVIKEPDGTIVFKMENCAIPKKWSQVASDIMISKYFRKAGVPQTDEKGNPVLDAEGNPVLGAEQSAAQVVNRLTKCWREWGEKYGYFASSKDADAFQDELNFMLINQYAAPNSPQWFNTGLYNSYGINGKSQGHYYVDPDTGKLTESEDSYSHPQPHACFIQSVDDDLVNEGGIMDLWVREARLFKYGSGTGTNFSRIRGANEGLSGGGNSSGLMSFLKIGDRAAGAIKSGGTTRRAAKMVCLDLDHPDIEEFIDWKVHEEKKVGALIAAGYDSAYDGEAYATVSGQNSNNSVRVPNAFIKAVKENGKWNLVRRTDGKPHKELEAKALWEKIANAAWQCADPGVQYDDTINEWHTCPEGGRINASNPCSEYMFLDNTACNLASINLIHFFDADKQQFLLNEYKHAIKLWTIVLEISVLMAQFPSKEIAQLSYEYRTLGLGYANLGTVLMLSGIPYDSKEALAVTGAVSAIMTGYSYATSAELAKVQGTFQRYPENKEHMLRVIRNHRRAAYNVPDSEYEGLTVKPVGINAEYAPEYLVKEAKLAWDEALYLGEQYGYRNAQTTVIAPTGTIGLLMDCDTTGVEPDFALVKFKKLAGGGYFKIINQSVKPALKVLGYTEAEMVDIMHYILGTLTFKDAAYINYETLIAKGFTEQEIAEFETKLVKAFSLNDVFAAYNISASLLERFKITEAELAEPGFSFLQKIGFTQDQIDEASRHICGTMTIEGAPHLKEEHLPVFDCANKCGNGERFIHHNGHIRIMAAAQSFISGAISKTINMPNEVTVQDIQDSYMLSWELGVKANAIYRDGSKLSQALYSSGSKSNTEESDAKDLYDDITLQQKVEELMKTMMLRGEKRDLPIRRQGLTIESNIGGQKIHLRTGEYEDGTLGEVFIDMFKEGASYRSLLNALAVAVSIGLQYGVPLEKYVDKFTFTRFEPSGLTNHPNIKTCTSIIDFIFRVLGMEYLNRTDFVHVTPTTETRSVSLKEIEIRENNLIAAKAANSMEQADKIATPKAEATAVANAAAATPTSTESTADESGDSVMSEYLKNMMGDAPACTECGHITVRNGACYKCLNCGNSLGCS